MRVRCPVQCGVIRVHEAHTARIKKRVLGVTCLEGINGTRSQVVE